MRIGKVHGSTVTRHSKGTRLVREISLSHPAGKDQDAGRKPQSIVHVSEANSKLLIGQWISAIDKTFSKPKTGRPSSEQYQSRNALGLACWRILIEKNLLDVDQLDYWTQRLHPYGETPNFVRDTKPGLNGLWHHAFTLAGKDTATIATRIHSHLHVRELRQDGRPKFGDHTQNRQGLIQNRAFGVERSVFDPSLVPSSKSGWSDHDEEAYCGKRDLAEEVLRAVTGDKRWSSNNPSAQKRKHIGSLVADHLEHVTGSRRCSVRDGAAENSEASQGLLSLHDAVRKHYKTLARNKNAVERFPKDRNALFSQLRNRSDNQMTNHLVRIGRICHYTASDDDSVLPQNIDASQFWLSLGQSQIKEAEAFVRVWRSAVAQGARAIKAWVDPDGLIVNRGNDNDEDITANGNIKAFLGNAVLRAKALQSQNLYFGGVGPFSVLGKDDEAHVFNACLRYLATCRHQSFHFRSRFEMINALFGELETTCRHRPPNDDGSLSKEISPPLSDLAARAIADFYVRDQSALNQRLLLDLQGAQVDRFCSDGDFATLFKSIQESVSNDDNDVTLPGFKRLLHRTGNIAKYVNGLQDKSEFTFAGIPPEPNLNSLKDAATNARYIGLQTLYDGPFRQYIGGMLAKEIAPFLDTANKNMTALAKSANRNSAYHEAIQGRSEHLPKISDGETIVQYSSRLTQITAQEFGVQKGYDSGPEEAKKQAGFIEDFKRDFIALVFEAYLGTHGFDWLKNIQPNQQQTNINPEEPIVDENTTEPMPWQPGLYLVLHFIPFDDVSRLLHQFKRWGALQSKLALQHTDTQEAEAQVRQFKQTLALYLKMHDGKIDGASANLDLSGLRELYEDPDEFDAIFSVASMAEESQANDSKAETVHATRKGLRNILRYNHLPALKFVFKRHKVQSLDIERLQELEIRKDGESAIKLAHQIREEIHDSTIKTKSASNGDLQRYSEALETIARHKALVGKVYFGDFVRVHRLMMMVIARLVDFAGLWERDCKPEKGFIAVAQKHLNTQKGGEITWNHPKADEARKIRNNLDHFNILAKDVDCVNLTDLANQVRTMMMYDRKLKNTVSKSIIEILAQEGIKLTWEMNDHILTNATIQGVDIKHFDKLKNVKRKPIERRHNPEFLEMVAVLFDGTVKGVRHSANSEIQNTPRHDHSARTAQPDTSISGIDGQRQMGRQTGNVKWFNKEKGYGFIVPDTKGVDVYARLKEVKASGLVELFEDQGVSFELEEAPDGRLRAVKLRLI